MGETNPNRPPYVPPGLEMSSQELLKKPVFLLGCYITGERKMCCFWRCAYCLSALLCAMLCYITDNLYGKSPFWSTLFPENVFMWSKYSILLLIQNYFEPVQNIGYGSKIKIHRERSSGQRSLHIASCNLCSDLKNVRGSIINVSLVAFLPFFSIVLSCSNDISSAMQCTR